MNQIEQTWKVQGYSDTDIAKMSAVMNHPLACEHAIKTRDFETAYKMTLPIEKEPQRTMLEFFSSFCEVHPDDSKSLSIALTKFARFVQSEVDKDKAP